jgi:hypothetical protein
MPDLPAACRPSLSAGATSVAARRLAAGARRYPLAAGAPVEKVARLPSMRTTGCFLLACGLLVVVLAMGNPFLGHVGQLGQQPKPQDPAGAARPVGRLAGGNDGMRIGDVPAGDVPIVEHPRRLGPVRAVPVRAFHSPIWLRPGAPGEGRARASLAWWYPSVGRPVELPGPGSDDWSGAPAGGAQAIPALHVDTTAGSGSK